MKNTITAMTFATIPTDYEALVRMFPLRPLHDKVDADNATEITDAMAGHDLTQDQEDYFSVLATLIDEYEQAHRPQPRRRHDPVGNLTFLMEQHQMNASDLGRLLGQRELGSKLLRKERQLSKAIILKLAEHFHVSPACFL
jgi:antitoxin component HigA of HigAB toxin-antitoxin module